MDREARRGMSRRTESKLVRNKFLRPPERPWTEHPHTHTHARTRTSIHTRAHTHTKRTPYSRPIFAHIRIFLILCACWWCIFLVFYFVNHTASSHFIILCPQTTILTTLSLALLSSFTTMWECCVNHWVQAATILPGAAKDLALTDHSFKSGWCCNTQGCV